MVNGVAPTRRPCKFYPHKRATTRMHLTQLSVELQKQNIKFVDVLRGDATLMCVPSRGHLRKAFFSLPQKCHKKGSVFAPICVKANWAMKTIRYFHFHRNDVIEMASHGVLLPLWRTQNVYILTARFFFFFCTFGGDTRSDLLQVPPTRTS